MTSYNVTRSSSM